MKQIILIFFLSFSFTVSAQNLTLENEIIICSFKTKTGKIVSLAKEKDDEYIIYRFGTENNIELEFPEKNNDSWEKFKFNGVSRHGGKENSGMAIYNVMFENGDYRYVLFTSFYAEADKNDADISNVGLYVINLITKKELKITGLYDTQEGNLNDLKDNNLIKVAEFDLYE